MKRILFLIIAMSIFAVSCDKDFGDLNVDKKNPSKVAPGALVATAQKQLTDLMTNSNVNRNIFRLLSQYWTETTYTDESNYDLATRNIPQNFWNIMYVNVLKNLDEAQRLIPDQDPAFFPPAVQANQNAVIEMLTVYSYAVLVNTFGNIPYSQALDFNNTAPAYDDARTIHNDLIARLDAAIAAIDESAGGFGSSDLLLGDDMAGWKRFGNSLKLRLGMTLADVDGAKAATIVEEAAPNVVLTNDENIYFHYESSPPNTNQIWVDLVQSGRKDFVAANTIVDCMLTLNDPRIPYYFTEDADGAYSGGIYGASNNYATFSKPADRIIQPDFEAIIFDAAEMQFLLAEAVERGMNVGGTAAEHYEAGIRASMEYWGVPEGEINAYLAQPEVAYATASGDWRQKIGKQLWLALYNRGYEGWLHWRRLDAPALVAPPTADTDIPLRYTYPAQEQTLNAENYQQAADAIGGDVVSTKLFWDVN